MDEDLVNVLGSVKYILIKYPDARGCDNVLVMRYWMEMDRARLLSEVGACTPVETITRARRKLQEEAKRHAGEPWANNLLPCNQVMINREFKREIFRESMACSCSSRTEEGVDLK